MTVYLGKKPVGVTKIVKKEVVKTKFGVSVDAFVGDLDADGKLSSRRAGNEFNGIGIKKVAQGALSTTFYREYADAFDPLKKILLPDLETIEAAGCRQMAYHCYGLIEVDLGNLTTIATSGLYEAFYLCGNLKTVKADKITTIASNYACKSAFSGTGVSNASMPNLVSITGKNACQDMFSNCVFDKIGLDNLVTIDADDACREMFLGLKIDTAEFPKLETITGNTACRNWFKQSTVKKIYFPMLTNISTSAFGTNNSYSAFYGCTALTEIHFRADMQATIEAMSQYANKWGATNATIYFSL